MTWNPNNPITKGKSFFPLQQHERYEQRETAEEKERHNIRTLSDTIYVFIGTEKKAQQPKATSRPWSRNPFKEQSESENSQRKVEQQRKNKF